MTQPPGRPRPYPPLVKTPRLAPPAPRRRSRWIELSLAFGLGVPLIAVTVLAWQPVPVDSEGAPGTAGPSGATVAGRF